MHVPRCADDLVLAIAGALALSALAPARAQSDKGPGNWTTCGTSLPTRG
jgi:hypothetical protein